MAIFWPRQFYTHDRQYDSVGSSLVGYTLAWHQCLQFSTSTRLCAIL